MAFMQYLKMEGVSLPLPDSYDLNLTDVEVVTIAVAFSVSAAWLARLTAFSKQEKIAVQYFDTEELALKETEMYVTGFKAKLYKDTSKKGLWTVSFTLNEL